MRAKDDPAGMQREFISNQDAGRKTAGIHPSDRLSAATIWQLWSDTVARCPASEFLFIPTQATHAYANGPLSSSYAETNHSAMQAASRYAAAGYGPGHRVALALDNRAEALIHFLALNSLGATAVPLNMELTAGELGYILGNVECSLVVALDEHCDALRTAMRVAGIDVPCRSLSENGPYPDCNRATGQALAALESIAAIVYTSGTTGRPKGCLLSNRYCLTVGEWYAGIGGLLTLREGAERIITPLPLYHINALVFTFVTAIRTRNCLVQLDRFHASTWWDSVRESAATAFHYLGVMPAILLQMPCDAKHNFAGQLRFGFGAGVDPRHHAAFEARFGVPLVEGWAMTETGAAACMMVTGEPRHVGSRHIGRPPPYLEIRVVDEHGKTVATGTQGEMLVRSRGADPRLGFFSGYFADEAATEAAWEGGWLHTGDVVRQDENGSLFFVERSKNLIRRSGENIAAAEVESALLDCSEVHNCAVTAVADTMRGEEVLALVILNPGYAADESTALSLLESCTARLSYFKLPGYIGFVDELPVTGTQKLKRRELRELSTAMLEAGNCMDFRERKRVQRSTVTEPNRLSGLGQ